MQQDARRHTPGQKWLRPLQPEEPGGSAGLAAGV